MTAARHSWARRLLFCGQTLASFHGSTIDGVAMAGDNSTDAVPSHGERIYPTQRRKSREIPVRGTQRKPMLQRQRGQMRVRHEIGMHTGEREEFI